MHRSVRDAFVPFSAGFEGVVPWLYADVLGLITVGIGNLVDPVDAALALPFVRPDGTPATRDEIRAAWHAVKSRPELAQQGHRVAARHTTIRLTPQGIHDLVIRKLDANHAALAKQYPEIEQWPADAQLATHSMAWACGPAFGVPGAAGRFIHLATALRERDFETAARECMMREAGNPGIVPRNRANRILYRNAAHSQSFQLDPSELFYPHELLTTDSEPHTPIPPTERTPDPSAVRQTGTSEAMRDVFAQPPVVIVDDTEDGES